MNIHPRESDNRRLFLTSNRSTWQLVVIGHHKIPYLKSISLIDHVNYDDATREWNGINSNNIDFCVQKGINI